MKLTPISKLRLTGNTNLRPYNNNRSSRNRRIKEIVLDLRREFFQAKGFSMAQIMQIEQTVTDPPNDFQYLRPNNTLDIAMHTLAHFSLQPIEIITAAPKVLRLTTVPKVTKSAIVDSSATEPVLPVDESLPRHLRTFQQNILFQRLTTLQAELQARMQRVLLEDPTRIPNMNWTSDGTE